MIKQAHPSDDATLQYRFTAYIVKALRNYKANYYNQRKRINSHEILFSEPPDELNISYSLHFDSKFEWDKIEDYIENEKVIAALCRLSDAESIIIFMRMVRQMTPGEIANYMGKSLSSINKMYYRAITKLRKEMGCPLPGGGEKE